MNCGTENRQTENRQQTKLVYESGSPTKKLKAMYGRKRRGRKKECINKAVWADISDFQTMLGLELRLRLSMS